jgi:hypothetical protein
MFDKSQEVLPVYKLRVYSPKEFDLELMPEEASKLQKIAWEALQAYRKLAGSLPR